MKIIFVSVKILLLNFIVLLHEERVIGTLVTLSPRTMAPVCRVGDPLQINCTASVQFIKWSILQPNEQGTSLVKPVNPVQINSRDENQMAQRTVNSSTFTFTRPSAQGALPLISTLSIDSVGIDLNGTVVRCADVANSTTLASTTVQIIDNSEYNTIQVCVIYIIYFVDQYTLNLHTFEEYSTDNVTVTVNWTQLVGAVYHSSVLPLAPMMPGPNGRSSLQLALQYNTEYNLSVMAVAPCKANTTAVITLNYGEV